MNEAILAVEKKEKIRRNVMIVCGLIGGITGGILSYFAIVNDDFSSLFGNSSIPFYHYGIIIYLIIVYSFAIIWLWKNIMVNGPIVIDILNFTDLIYKYNIYKIL